MNGYGNSRHSRHRSRHAHRSRNSNAGNLLDFLTRSKFDSYDNSDYDYDLVSGNAPLSLLDLLFMLPTASRAIPQTPFGFTFTLSPRSSLDMGSQEFYGGDKTQNLLQTTFMLPDNTDETTTTEQPALVQTTFVPPVEEPVSTPTETPLVPPPATPQTTPLTPPPANPQQPSQSTTETSQTTPVSPPAQTTPVEIAPPQVPTKPAPKEIASATDGVEIAPKTTNKVPLPDVISYRSAP